MKRFHYFDDRDIRAVIDELMIRLGSVGPAPGVGERVELRLAHLAARLAKQDVVIRVRVKRRIQINKIDTRIRELATAAQPLQIVTEIQAVHAIMFTVKSSGALLALQLRTHAETSRLGVHLNAKSRTTTRSSRWRSRGLTVGVVDLLSRGFSTANN